MTYETTEEMPVFIDRLPVLDDKNGDPAAVIIEEEVQALCNGIIDACRWYLDKTDIPERLYPTVHTTMNEDRHGLDVMISPDVAPAEVVEELTSGSDISEQEIDQGFTIYVYEDFGGIRHYTTAGDIERAEEIVKALVEQGDRAFFVRGIQQIEPPGWDVEVLPT